MTAFAKCLLAMCEQLKDLLRTESRLLRLRSPVYILGKLSSLDMSCDDIISLLSSTPTNEGSDYLV